MSTIQTLTSRTLLAAAVAAALSVPAFAQVRQVPMGNNLDANPNTNSGGSNQPVSGYVPINGNDIMTGNVTGLGYFHGNTAISSPYTFQAPLGSSSLGGFAARTAPPTRNYAPTTYYLPSSTVSTGQGSLYSAPIGAGFDSRLVPVTSYNPAASSTQIRALNTSGAIQGIAVDRLPPASLPQDASVQGGTLNNPLFLMRTTAELERLRIEQAKEAATRPAETPATQPTLQVDQQVNGSRTSDGGSPEKRGGKALDESINGDVGEVFARLAEELRTAAGVPTVADQTPVSMTNPIDPLTGKPRLVASSLAPTAGTDLASGRGGSTRGKPNSDKTATAISAKPLENLSTAQLSAGGKVKPLKMAPAPTGTITPTGFSVQMVRAEQALRDGKFIDAQIAYQTALAEKPDDPLALVGLAHAELAAGAFVPAAYDLKFVFTRRPEMIAVRYDPDSFIPAARQEQLIADLRRQMNNKENAEMARFLYCYLCYQTGRTTQLDAELRNWGNQEGHDNWQPVLSRAWHDVTVQAPQLKEPVKDPGQK